MKKKWIIIGVIAIIVLFIGINIWQQQSKKTLTVETASLKNEMMTETVMTPGTLTLAEEQYVYLQPEKGEVDEILVKEGDKIKQGDPLLRYSNQQLALEKKQNDLQIRSVALEVEKTQKEHNEIDKELEKDRNNELLKEEHDQIKLQHQLANIELEQANLQKESIEAEQAELTVTSDVGGTILSVNEKASSQGEAAEQSIIRIGSLNHLVVEGTISEYETLNIKKDQSVTLTSDAVPDEKWKGKVSYIGDLPEENSALGMETGEESVLYPIRITLEDEINLKPGFSMLIDIVTSEKEVDTLPIAAVQQEDEDNFVYVVKDGKAQRVDVKVGAVDTKKMEIKDGVSADDDVIITNVGDITPGMEVNVK